MKQPCGLSRKKLPAYARELFERQKFQNLPLCVVTCIGVDAWNRAKKWRKSPNDIEAVVIDNEPPNQFRWPVANCLCIVEWDVGPSEKQVIELIEVLLKHGASAVTVNPLFVNFDSQIYQYDRERPIADRWVQTRETIRTYVQSKETANVA